MKTEFESLENNIKLFKVYTLFSGKLFIATTQVLFLTLKGFTFTQIMLISSITEILGLILEIPSGFFADKYGNKLCLLVGIFFSVFGNIFAIVGTGNILIFGFSISSAIGGAMLSGADQAFLYNTILKLNREDEFKDIWRDISSKKMYFTAMVTVFSGFLFKINVFLPFISTTICYIIAAIAVIGFKDVRGNVKDNKKLKEYVKIVYEFFHRNIPAQILLVLDACFVFLFLNQNVLLQEYVSNITFPIEFIGIVFLIFNLISAFSLKHGKAVEKIMKQYTMVFFTLLTVICLMLAGVAANIYGLFFLAICRVCIAIINPIVDTEINRGINRNDVRATILSFYNAGASIPDAFLAPVLGSFIDTLGIFSAYKIFGLSGLVAVGICFYSLIYGNCSGRRENKAQNGRQARL
ncbi:MAG: hypothetical protein Q4C65_10410 [Eubacteriales bacterium]|nr:hypothetical protein [Eubacteriales bacterium]